MEKRFAAFLALAFLILTVNAILVSHFAGPPPGVPAQANRDAEKPPAQAEPGADALSGAGPADAKSAEEPSQAPRPPAPAEAETPQDQAHPQVAAGAPQEEVAQQWFTIGSVDVNDGYRMLVTLTDRGAAVERVELSSTKYSDAVDRSGYLGHLALEDMPDQGGARIRVVGAGTPAAQAGLKAADVITALDDQKIRSAEDLHGALKRKRPNREVRISFLRDGETRVEPLRLRQRPLDVMRPERENIVQLGAQVPPNIHDPPSLLLTAQSIGSEKLEGERTELAGVDLREGPWEVVERTESSVAFRRRLPGRGLEFTKRFALSKLPPEARSDPAARAYDLQFEIEIRNVGDRPQTVAYQIDGPNGLPVEGWWYGTKVSRTWSSVGLRDMFVRFEDRDPLLFGTQDIVDGKVELMGQGRSLMFAGIDTQYFAAVMIPQKARLQDVWFAETRALVVDPKSTAYREKRLHNVTCRLVSNVVSLEPNGDPLRHTFSVFAGPKVPRLLAQHGQPRDMRYNLTDLVYYGWFGWVAKPMLALLHFFYAIFRNYGIAIVLLTVLVRGCMFPLSLKQTKSMQKMQELQPEMKRIVEKYKGDVEKRTKAQQELFRKHSYNPMGGCLLLFFQLPIFIGLYRSLMVDVELRQAPLLGHLVRWCSNLAAPDMLLDWSRVMPDFINHGTGMFGLGPYLNVLPIVTVGLYLWQQKITMPPPADEQAAMQQTVMKYMMIFIGIMFYKVASGLCLYFIASTLWSLGERKLLPKAAPASAGPTAPGKSAPTQIAADGQQRGDIRKKERQKQRRD